MKKSFTPAEVLMEKGESGNKCLHLISRTNKPKEPTINTKFKVAFTLAEVLITLAVIGIVASLTIPAVVQNYQERQTVTSLKKFYSDINQAFQMATVHKGKIENQNMQNTSDLANYFKPYLKIIKDCKKDTSCFYVDKYKSLDNKTVWNNVSSRHHILTANGIVTFYLASPDCTLNRGTKAGTKEICGSLYIDINGAKSPNRWGLDVFSFRISRQGIYPSGMQDEDTYTLQKYCNITIEGYSQNGQSCSAWIITKGNMDYLKHEISW